MTLTVYYTHMHEHVVQWFGNIFIIINKCGNTPKAHVEAEVSNAAAQDGQPQCEDK